MSRRLPDVPYSVDNEELRWYLQELARVIEQDITDLEHRTDFRYNIESLSATSTNTAINAGDTSVILVDVSASAVTVTLPDPYEHKNHIFYVKKINGGAGTITVQVDGGANINGSSTHSLTGANYPCIGCFSDGTQYWLLTHIP